MMRQLELNVKLDLKAKPALSLSNGQICVYVTNDDFEIDAETDNISIVDLFKDDLKCCIPWESAEEAEEYDTTWMRQLADLLIETAVKIEKAKKI